MLEQVEQLLGGESAWIALAVVVAALGAALRVWSRHTRGARRLRFAQQNPPQLRAQVELCDGGQRLHEFTVEGSWYPVRAWLGGEPVGFRYWPNTSEDGKPQTLIEVTWHQEPREKAISVPLWVWIKPDASPQSKKRLELVAGKNRAAFDAAKQASLTPGETSGTISSPTARIPPFAGGPPEPGSDPHPLPGSPNFGIGRIPLSGAVQRDRCSDCGATVEVPVEVLAATEKLGANFEPLCPDCLAKIKGVAS